MADVHPTAVVDPSARLAPDVRVGPYCVVGPHVELGAGVELLSHVVVAGRTRLGPRTRAYPFAAIGHAPQDLKYAGEASRLVVGADCAIREGATLHPGTRDGGMETRVGDRCLLMAQAHVGHDCRLGDDIVLSNNVMLAGHVTVGDRAALGGGAAVHQFVRIGEGAFLGGLSGLEGDLPPFCLAMGARARIAGLNLVGLRRAGVANASIRALQRALAGVFGNAGVLSERIASARDDDPLVQRLLAFLRETSSRPLCRPAS